MSIPSSCQDCSFYNRCNSSMYMNGCAFYGLEDKPKTVATAIKEFFSKFFSR